MIEPVSVQPQKIFDEVDVQSVNAPSRSVFLPLVLLFITVLIGALSQGVNTYRQWHDLDEVHKNQETKIQAATRLRAQLDGLARETAILANNGNSNARIVVQELQKRGVSIDVNATPLPSPAN
jgi:hypothetical protein